MSDDPLQSDLEEFVAYFSEAQNLALATSGDPGEAEPALTACPGGAVRVLVIGLRSKGTVIGLAEKSGLGELAERAGELLDQLAPHQDLLEDCLQRRGVTFERLTGREKLLMVEPMFDIDAEEVVIHWKAFLREGQTYESTDTPASLLALFPPLGRAVMRGLEGMEKLGWSMSPEDARYFTRVLKECAETVEILSSLLPSSVTGAATDDGTPD